MISKNSFDHADQAKKCLRLWASVVHAAIMDSCISPTEPKKQSKESRLEPRLKLKGKPPLRHSVLDAIEFLFTPSRSDPILLYMDIDGSQFRRKLLDVMWSQKEMPWLREVITDVQRRAFRYNYNWYQKHQAAIKNFIRSKNDLGMG